MANEFLEMIKKDYQLSNGPSKYDLMVSLFSRDSNITFTLFTGKFFRFTTRSIQAEDGSREKWIITGTAEFHNALKPEFIKIYFDSRDRKGYIMDLD